MGGPPGGTHHKQPHDRRPHRLRTREGVGDGSRGGSPRERVQGGALSKSLGRGCVVLGRSGAPQTLSIALWPFRPPNRLRSGPASGPGASLEDAIVQNSRRMEPRVPVRNSGYPKGQGRRWEARGKRRSALRREPHAWAQGSACDSPSPPACAAGCRRMGLPQPPGSVVVWGDGGRQNGPWGLTEEASSRRDPSCARGILRTLRS